MGYESMYPRTPVGQVEVKDLPERLSLQAGSAGDPFDERGASFKKLFNYIEQNQVAMTVPVEASATTNTMTFFVGQQDIHKDLASKGEVQVRPMQAMKVVSVGLRGSYTQARFDQGIAKIQQWLASHPQWVAQGEPYAVYWNSPFMPGFLKVSEVHQPVCAAVQEINTGDDATTASLSPGIYGFTMKDIDGKPVPLASYQGHVLLIVNVASRCGFTPQYQGLQKLYEQYKERGLVVLGFPANNFLGQEPGSDLEIKEFCTTKYSVTFPMFSKISVKGKDQHPLYAWLTGEQTDPDFAGEIGWNFNKFLVDRQGNVIARFGSRTAPDDKELIQAIEQALAP